MEEVVDKVQERWLGSIDKEEPEIADEFYHKMRDAIREIHATEGFVNVKVAKARDGEADWLTTIVQSNSKMRDMIPKIPEAEGRIAVADSWVVERGWKNRKMETMGELKYYYSYLRQTIKRYI